MTNEEAIEILDRFAHHSHSEVVKYPHKVAIEAFEMAIEVLKAEPCEDAVSREAVLACEKHIWDDCGVVSVEDVKALPPVTPKPKTGKWIKTEEWITPTNNVSDDYQIDVYTCSCCKSEFNVTSLFCSKCGARMDGMEG